MDNIAKLRGGYFRVILVISMAVWSSVTTNGAPVVDNPIDDQSLDEYFGSTTIDLSNVFSDTGIDPLTYSAVNSNDAVVTVSILGSILTIAEAGLGSSTIIVTANNGTESIADTFAVVVSDINGAPVVESPLPDVELDEYFEADSIDLTGLFSDPDPGDVLTVTVTSSDETVVTALIEGSTLIITEVGLGSSTLTVTATDNGTPLLSVSDTIAVLVNDINGAPVVASPLPDVELDEYFEADSIDLTGLFSDPDPGDVLTVTVTSSDETVVTALIEGSTLIITEVGLGSSTLTVTATDNGTPLLSVSDTIAVLVNDINGAPVVASPLPDVELDEYFEADSIDLTGLFSDPDPGDVLTYTVSSSDPAVVTTAIEGSTLIITEVGLGSSTLTVTATDNGTPLLSVSDTIAVLVNDINGAPVVASPLPDVEQDEYFEADSIDLTGLFSDPDPGDVLTVTVTSSDETVVTALIEGSTLIITEVGLGSSTLTVTATDNGTPLLSVSDTIAVVVNDINGAPVVASPLPDVELDEYFEADSIDLTGLFSDPDPGDVLTYTVSSSDPAVVTTAIEGSTLIITEVGLGSSTLTVTATDNGTPLLSVSDTIAVVVNDINGAPVVESPLPDVELDEYFEAEAVALTGLFSDPDPGDVLTYTVASSDPAVVTAAIEGSRLIITEVGLGSSILKVTATDNGTPVLDMSDDFTVTVYNVNDPPEVVNPLVNLELNEYFESENIDLTDVFSDKDNDNLTLSVLSGTSSVVTVSLSGNTLTIQEAGLGTSTITVTATDDGTPVLSTDETFTVTVNNVNDPPVVDNPLPDVVQDEHFDTFNVDLTGVFSDKDEDPLTLSVFSSNPAVVTVSVEGTTLTVTETGLGSSIVTVTASDGPLSVDEQFQFTVNNVNDPPEIISPIDDQLLNEHFDALAIALAGVFSDPDADVLLLTARSSDPTVVTVSVSGTNLVIVERGLGTAEITVTASDGSLSIDEQFGVRVNNVNDAPVVVSPISSISRNEGFGSVNIDLGPVFIDPDDDAMTYGAISSNTNVVTVSISGTTLTITEAGLGLGLSTITVTADDGALSTDDQFTFTINNINDEPEVVQPIGNRSYDEGFASATINLSTRFSDPDGDVLSFTAESSVTDVVTVSVSGSILTIFEVGLGTSDITVTATDNGDGNLSVSDEFTVSVLNVNDAPQLENPVANQAADEYFGTLDIDLSATFSDPDDDDLTITAISSNSGVVTVSMEGSVLRITEQGLGLSVITLTASDGALSISTQFTVTVNNVNDAPVVVSVLPDRVYEEGFNSFSFSLAPVFVDPDGDVLSLSAISSNTDVVTVSIVGTTLTIAEAEPGVSTITVTASDGELSTAEEFIVTMNNVNDAPVVENPIPDSVVDEFFGSIEINISDVFSDPDAGEILSYSAISRNTNVVTVSVEGAILTITEVGPGEAIIAVTASDGSLSVEEQFSITVTDINVAPELIEPIPDQNMVENIGSAELELDSYFSDIYGDVLTYSVELRDTGIVSYELDQSLLLLTPVDTGSTMVTITASDPDGLMAADSFMVHIEKELLFIVRYGSNRIQNQDTIILCNDAGQIAVKVSTKATWGFTNDYLWMAVEIDQDSTLSVAFSSNLTGRDRIGDVTLSDAQGHVLKFFVKQTENCLSSVVPGDRRVDLKMYPNPVEDRLFIDTGEWLRRGMKIEVIDQLGKLLFVEQVKEDASGLPLEIDLHGYIAGPYYIRISDERGSFTGKVVKQ